MQGCVNMNATLKGAVAGAIGGLAGTLAMNYAQRLWTLAADGAPPDSAAGKHDAREWQERDERQNSNEIAAQKVADATVDRRLTERELSVVAPIIHFSFGALVGALHGASAEKRAGAPASGVGLGAGLWLTADEMAMPLLGLSRSTLRRPLEMHLQSFAAHLVYGVVAEHVRRAIRAA